MSRPLAPESGGALHNMSAPPRSTLTLRPFQVPPAGAPDTKRSTAWGLSWVLRVDIQTLMVEAFPGSLPPDIAAPHRPNPYLCGAVALARGLRGETIAPWDLEDRLPEDLADELMRLAPGPEQAAGIPPVMMASPAGNQERPTEPDPGRALAVLTHLSGRVCNLAASPAVAEALLQGEALDLWAPEASHA